MNIQNTLNKNTLPQLLEEIIAEIKQIDSNLTRMEELLHEIEQQYNEIDLIIENLKKQIK